MSVWQRGVGGNQFPTFDAESKFAKIPNSHVQLEGEIGGNQFPKVSFKFSKSSPELKFPFCKGGGVGGNQFPKVNFKCSKSSPELKFPLGGGGWQSTSTNINFKISKSNPELKFPFPWGGGGEGGRVGHGMHGIWCCHLACILGELADFDTKFCNTFWASASQIVPFGN